MRTAATLLLLLASAGAAWPQARDGVADALHPPAPAEMRQFRGEEDVWRRPLYLDPVDIESTPAGFPCDHLAARRPDVVAGRGSVFLYEAAGPPPRRLRYWHPPGDAGDAAEAAKAFVAKHVKDGEARLLATREFPLVPLIASRTSATHDMATPPRL